MHKPTAHFLLFGKPFLFKDAVKSGTAAGIGGFALFQSGLFASALPEIPVSVILAALMPILWFTLAFPMVQAVRSPRKNTPAFFAGISRETRRVLFVEEVRRNGQSLALFALVAGLCDLILAAVFGKSALITALSVLIPPAETLLFTELLCLLFRRNVPWLEKRDETSSRTSDFLQLGSVVKKISWNLAVLCASPLRGAVKSAVKRSLTAVFRHDLILSVLLPAVLLLGTAAVPFLVPDSPIQFLSLAALFCAAASLGSQFEPLQTAAASLKNLHMYRFMVRQITGGTAYTVLLYTWLFPILFFISAACTSPAGFGIESSLQFILCWLYLVEVCTIRLTLLTISENPAVSAGYLYTVPAVLLPGIWIPGWGALFPLIAGSVLLAAEKQVLAKDVYHRIIAHSRCR